MFIHRRRFLGAAAALGAASAAGCAGVPNPLSGGAAPSVTRVAAGVSRLKLGSIQFTSVPDGFVDRPLVDGFVRNATVAQVQGALREAGMATDVVRVPFTPFVLESGGQRILLDAGNGQFGAPTSGKLLESLGAAGISPASINHVVFSHFHGDHINGLRNRDGSMAFPNARLHAPAPEWNFWMDDARMNAAPEAGRGNFQAVRRVFGPIAGSVNRFTPGAEVLPGLMSMPAFGHTPGHTAFSVATGGRKLVYWADTTNVSALFVRNPDWAIMFDMDPDAARAVRRRMLEQALAENWILAGYHLPLPAFGTIVRRGSGFDFNPMV